MARKFLEKDLLGGSRSHDDIFVLATGSALRLRILIVTYSLGCTMMLMSVWMGLMCFCCLLLLAVLLIGADACL